MSIQKELITSEGVNIIRDRIHSLNKEARLTMEEMKEVRDNSLSTEDTSEVNQYNQRYESLQEQIKNLNNVLNNCQVLEIQNLPTDKVRFGNIVTIVDIDTDEEKTYQILGTYESDPKNGKISYTSPLGKALMGLQLDDVVDINIAGSEREFEIIDIK